MVEMFVAKMGFATSTFKPHVRTLGETYQEFPRTINILDGIQALAML